MDCKLWNQFETDFAFKKIDAIVDFILHNFQGDSSVNVGFIYISTGRDGGKVISRYLLIIPFYNPAINGYNFSINHGFVFARGFNRVVSKDFYQYLDETWIRYINRDQNQTLFECSPLMIATLDDSLIGGFEEIPWCLSLDCNNSLSIIRSDFNAWIYGPKDSSDFQNKFIINNHDIFKQLISAWLTSSSIEEKDGIIDELANRSLQIIGDCKSFSFPTFQLELTSPMAGTVPFLVNPVRMKFAGVIESSDKRENKVCIIVARSDYDGKYLKFQRLWNSVKDVNLVPSQKINCLRNQIYKLISTRIN